jgi:hypothetical protein
MLTCDKNSPVKGNHDAFDHICGALFLEPEKLMLIVAPDPLTLYCDASRNGGYTVVAGAIASVNEWKTFDSEWSPILKKSGLAYFRMSEFAHSTGQFKSGWKKNEERRRQLLLDLATVIHRNVRCWIGACVSQRDYDAADEIFELHEFLQPYPLCGYTCVELAYKWRELRHLDYLPMEYIFEEGDEHAGQLSDAVRRYKGQYPIFRRKREEETQPSNLLTPLQVGDFAAYEIGKFYGVVDPAQNKLFERMRTSFELFRGIPTRWGQWTHDSIRPLLNAMEVKRRER